MKKLVYLSHPSSGLKCNTDKITAIMQRIYKEKDLTDQFTFVSPIHNFGHMYHMTDYETGLEFCVDLLSRCELMLMFDNWERSRGCTREYAYCLEHNIKVIKIADINELEEFIRKKEIYI